MFTIESTIDIAAPLASVRTALTTESGYRAWWAEDTDFDGRQATFRFSQPTELRSVTFRVDRWEDGGIVMTCTGQENNPDWLGTTLAFEVGAIPTGTRVRLVHAGYPAKNEVYERCAEAWPYFLRSLERYMMTGAGQAFPKSAKALPKEHGKEHTMPANDADSRDKAPDSDALKTAMLIFRDEGVDWAALAADGRSKALFQKLVDWAADLKRRGVYAGVEALSSGGKTVRRKGAGLVIDGPFAEGREAVLGYFLVRVKDVDEACALASESPHAEIGGTTEVRLLGTFPKP